MCLTYGFLSPLGSASPPLFEAWQLKVMFWAALAFVAYSLGYWLYCRAALERCKRDPSYDTSMFEYCSPGFRGEEAVRFQKALSLMGLCVFLFFTPLLGLLAYVIL